MEESNNYFSARASNTAVVDGLLAQRESFFAGRERHLETAPAQPQAQLQEREARISALEARLAALWCRYARTARSPLFQERAPRCTRTRAEVGASTPPHHERLMAGDMPASTFPQPIFTGERRRVNTHTSLGNLCRPHFPHPMALPFRSPLSEEVFGSNEEDLCFLQFDVDTCAPRV
ncbi:hypothetical protein TcBrA4_0071370 [Trypanosoma cruzi]|nr:hypothetical protein TcBrA4_0071370 [Trypanosoma cruzi]